MKQETIERLRKTAADVPTNHEYSMVWINGWDFLDILAVLEAAQAFARADDEWNHEYTVEEWEPALALARQEALDALLALIDLSDLRVLGGTK